MNEVALLMEKSRADDHHSWVYAHDHQQQFERAPFMCHMSGPSEGEEEALLLQRFRTCGIPMVPRKRTRCDRCHFDVSTPHLSH